MALYETSLNGLKLAPYCTVGRSLCATRDFDVGDVVLKDTPCLEWDASKPLPDDLEKLREKHDVASYLAAVTNQFILAPTNARKVVLDMHAPPMEIGSAAVQMTQFAIAVCASFAEEVTETLEEETSEKEAEEEEENGRLKPEDLLHAMMAAKTNAHRRPNGNWSLFPLASKLAHSCDPNLMYIAESATFVAVRPVVTGAMLSFSYIGGHPLIRSTPQRQRRMLASHLFTCQCSRCRGRDLCRGQRCPRCVEVGSSRRRTDDNEAQWNYYSQHESPPPEGTVYRLGSELLYSDYDMFPSKPWRCDTCGYECTDDDLSEVLATEERVVPLVEKLANTTYKYNDLKLLLTQCGRVFGKKHWMYCVLCYHMAQYFKLMVANGCGDGARHLVMAWGCKYLGLLEDLGLRLVAEPTSHEPNTDNATTTPKNNSTKNNNKNDDGAEQKQPTGQTTHVDPTPSKAKDDVTPQAFLAHMVPASFVVTLVDVCGGVSKYNVVLQQLSRLAYPLVRAAHGPLDQRAAKIAMFAKHGFDTGREHSESLSSVRDITRQLGLSGGEEDDYLFSLWDSLVAFLMLKKAQKPQTPGLTPATTQTSLCASTESTGDMSQ